MNPRSLAIDIIQKVLNNHASLSELLQQIPSDSENNLVAEMCYGVIRYYHQLNAYANELLEKPFKVKDQDLLILILLGFYQLKYMRVADHAAVNETVNVVVKIKKNWAKGLVNGVLRNFIKQQEHLTKQIDLNDSAKYSHPHWLIQKLMASKPLHWQSILTANNQKPPLSLRVNLKIISREQYLKQLAAANISATAIAQTSSGVILHKATNVQQIPGFNEGLVSVQDGAAQLATMLLDLAPGQRVLDACAAPGGKTCHILEAQPALDYVLALDNSATRMAKISENLQRLNLECDLVCADAKEVQTWWDHKLFDRILLDAPCSASGVIRRHPEIKLQRKPDDVIKLVTLQASLLEALWPLLKPGGKLVYATCSILSEENELQIANFLKQHVEANLVKINIPTQLVLDRGLQILPAEFEMDGFYYAVLEKQ